MSLAGKTIVITRDPSQARPIVKQLTDLGAEVFQFPTIKITGVDERDKILATLGEIRDFNWIIFTSSNAVKYFLSYVDMRRDSLSKIKIACVGNETARLLTEINLKPALMPRKYTTRDLLKTFQEHDLKGKRVLIPVSNLARHDLEKELQIFGAKVQRVEVYKNVPYNDNRKKKILYKRICDDQIDCITFFSPSALNSFIKIMGKDIVALINSSRIVLAVIGPTTAQAVRDRGLKHIIEPEKSDSHGLVQALEQYYTGNESPLRKGG